MRAARAITNDPTKVGKPASRREDIVGGLTSAAVVIPKAMAYAAIAGLPLGVGLYTALIPLVVYAFLGTSRVLSVTTTSTIAILTAAALERVAPGADDAALVSAAATLACAVGAMLLLGWVLRLGAAASFISEPVLVGFKAGLGLVILVDQLPKLLGIHFEKGRFLQNVVSIVGHLPETSIPTILLGAATLALLVVLERFFPRVPASLMAVAGGIAATSLFGLERHGIELVGEVRAGLPALSLPDTSLLADLWPSAIGIALMSFVETVAAGQAFRNAGERRITANRELLAIGMTNILGGLFQNMPSGGGTSQTAVNRRAGARSQLAGIVTAVLVLAVLLFLAPLIHRMPQTTLAAIVILPCIEMVEVHEFRMILRGRVMEFSWAIAAVAGVMALGTLRGIVVAVVLSLLALTFHANRRPVFVMVRKLGTDVFRPKSAEHPDDEAFPGLLILRTEGVIHFANALRVGGLMRRHIEEQKPKVVILDCSAIPDFEYTALKMLTEAEKEFRAAGLHLWLAALNPEALARVQASELGTTLGRERMQFTVQRAVEKFLADGKGA